MRDATPTIAPGAKLADGVLVINLDHRPERLERFAAMADGFPQLAGWERLPGVHGVELPGFGEPPWFRSGKRDKCWAGRAGCALSHRNAIARAKEAGWNSVLILEDDVLPGPAFADDAGDFLSRMAGEAPPWSICYLGWSKQSGPAHKLFGLARQRSLCRVYGCIGAFAYLLRRDAFDWILERLPTPGNIWPWIARHRAIDRWYARNLSPRFVSCAVSPSLIGHYSSFSDIGQRGGATITTSAAADDPSAALRCGGAAGFAARSRLRRLWLCGVDRANIVRAATKRARGL